LQSDMRFCLRPRSMKRFERCSRAHYQKPDRYNKALPLSVVARAIRRLV
jgi:hypothetical protein